MWCIEPGQLLVLPREGDNVGEGFERLYSALTLAYELKGLPHDVREKMIAGIEKLGSIPTVVAVPEGEEEHYAQLLTNEKRVRTAIPNYHLELSQSGIKIDRAAIAIAIRRLNADPSASLCGIGARVAILDTGIDPTSLSHTARLQTYQLNTDDPANNSLFDDHGHGTLVASIIESIAPSAELLSVKVFGQHGNAASLTIGLLQAMKAFDPHVINLSLALSATPSCPNCGNYLPGVVAKQQLETMLAHITAGSEPILVAAAGNGDSGRPLLPADCENVLAVGSYDYVQSKPVYRYRQVEPKRFVFAPGGMSSAPLGKSYLRNRRGATLHGTSFAAAFTSGIAARYVCSQQGRGPCAGKVIAGVTPRHVALHGIAANSIKNYAGFMPQTHGLGLLNYN